MSDDVDISLLAAELKKLRGRKGLLTSAKLSGQPELVELIGDGDLDWALENLKGHLYRASLGPSRAQRAAALSLLVEEELTQQRLEQAGELLHAEARTVRAWGDNGGFAEIAADLLYTLSSRKAVARQTIALTYPTEENGLLIDFIADLPEGVTGYDGPVIRINDQDVLDRSDHIVRRDQTKQAVEHRYGIELMGLPAPPDDLEPDVEQLPLLQIQFTVPLDVRTIHRFVSDFRSNSYYVSCQSLGQSQVAHIVWRRS